MKKLTQNKWFKAIEKLFNQPKPTEEEIRVAKMMAVLFDGQKTETIIDTLLYFDEKVKTKLSEIKQQANTDRYVTDFYLGTNLRQKITI